eukprot:CAMPEP_0202908798 /NCGR_PEP_ID=MMETSP1392-20130828/47266_1 /ASSEMBLY_ACC=CAM_ASM_000868 /TAXON_ID=225041 /ORGANISM="Chlamydomonas chlamydogama, Strain SAG 11-48b" /LENGTH=38 /DNA_ID= /DNA_START= /DNA_END= /DNA_ORIENTATION=
MTDEDLDEVAAHRNGTVELYCTHEKVFDSGKEELKRRR